MPQFTLVTPNLSRPALYSANSDDDMLPPPPTPGPATAATNATKGNDDAGSVFDMLSSAALEPALARLQAFWHERRQSDVAGGDLGQTTQDSPPGASSSTTATVPPTHTVMDPLGAAALYTTASAADTPVAPGSSTAAGTPSEQGGDLGTRTSDTMFGAQEGRSSAPAPSSLAAALAAKRLKGAAWAAKAEEMRMGNDKHGAETSAWWLDIMCPSVADMKELRKVSVSARTPRIR